MKKELYLYVYNQDTGDFCEQQVKLEPYFPEVYKDKWEVSINVFDGAARFNCTKVIEPKDIDSKILTLTNSFDEGLAYITTEKHDISNIKAIFINHIFENFVNKLQALKEQENQIYNQLHKEIKMIDSIHLLEQGYESEVEF